MMKYGLEPVLSLLIIVLALFWSAGVWVKWIIVIAALILFLKSVMHPCCMPLKQAPKKAAKKKKK